MLLAPPLLVLTLTSSTLHMHMFNAPSLLAPALLLPTLYPSALSVSALSVSVFAKKTNIHNPSRMWRCFACFLNTRVNFLRKYYILVILSGQNIEKFCVLLYRVVRGQNWLWIFHNFETTALLFRHVWKRYWKQFWLRRALFRPLQNVNVSYCKLVNVVPSTIKLPRTCSCSIALCFRKVKIRGCNTRRFAVMLSKERSCCVRALRSNFCIIAKFASMMLYLRTPALTAVM